MKEDELLSLCKSEIRQSVGYVGGELAAQRTQAMDYYYGNPFGNEQPGQSSYVSRDVMDTVEWILPSLMRIFASGDQIVRFEPHGPEDEGVAKQVTDYVNYVFTRQNNGFFALLTFFKDALLQKNGFLKVYWEEYDKKKKEIYEGLGEDEVNLLLADPNVRLVEHTPREDGLHDVKIEVTEKTAGICIKPVPPEEFVVNSYACYPLEENRFLAHHRQITISELKEMGYDVSDDIGGDETSGDWNTERIARFSYDDTDFPEGKGDKSQRVVWISECYVLVDYDGDGISERRKVVIVGDQVLENEEVDYIPFVTLTPNPIPHKLFGLSMSDVVGDLQLLKSALIRNILDNAYLTNNNRWMALDGMVNIDDLLVSRPGGVIRVKTFDAVKPFPVNVLGAPMFNLLEYVETVKENRTGVTRYNQGVDANSLNKTATGISQIMSASQQRIELIARIFAETGVKDLFGLILQLVLKHEKQSKMVRLSNEWVPIDPRLWSNKYDVSVMVGLGTGSREMQMAGVQQVLNLQLTAMQGGLPIVTPQNLYASAIELTKANSMKGGEMFFTSPDKIPPAPPQQDPGMVQEQLRDKRERDLAMMDMQMRDVESRRNIGVEVFKVRTDAGLKSRDHELKVGDQQISGHESGLKAVQLRRQIEHDQRMQEAEAKEAETEQKTKEAELDINEALKTLAQTVVASQQAVVQSQQALAQVMQGQEKVAEALSEAAKAIGAPRRLVKGPDGTKMSVPVM